MRGFVPSPHSASAPSSEYGADLSWLGPAIQAGGAIVSTSVQTVGARKAQEAQQKADLQLAKAQEELLRLQAEGEKAKTTSARAASSLEAQATSRTLFVAGGLILLVGTISTILLIRSRRKEEE